MSRPTLVGRAPRRPRKLAFEVSDALVHRIEAGALTPGDKLPTEARLVAEFGVSRTVVREALSKLQEAGHIETRHGIGTFVAARGAARPFYVAPEQLATNVEVITGLEFRIGLEIEAAALAAERRTQAHIRAMRRSQRQLIAAAEDNLAAVQADLAFHTALAQASGNRYFVEMMVHLGGTLFPRSRLAMPLEPGEDRLGYLMFSHREHDDIIGAIEAGKGDAARSAMRRHLLGSKERLGAAHAKALAAGLADKSRA